jgi:hypothetical protein
MICRTSEDERGSWGRLEDWRRKNLYAWEASQGRGKATRV